MNIVLVLIDRGIITIISSYDYTNQFSLSSFLAAKNLKYTEAFLFAQSSSETNSNDHHNDFVMYAGIGSIKRLHADHDYLGLDHNSNNVQVYDAGLKTLLDDFSILSPDSTFNFDFVNSVKLYNSFTVNEALPSHVNRIIASEINLLSARIDEILKLAPHTPAQKSKLYRKYDLIQICSKYISPILTSKPTYKHNNEIVLITNNRNICAIADAIEKHPNKKLFLSFGNYTDRLVKSEINPSFELTPKYFTSRWGSPPFKTCNVLLNWFATNRSNNIRVVIEHTKASISEYGFFCNRKIC